MPCDTIATSTIKMEMKADNKELLKAALAGLGYQVVEIGESISFADRYRTVSGVFAKGQLQITSRNPETFDINSLKRAYSHQIVQSQAKKFGWKIKQDGNKYAVQKAGF